MECRCCAKVPFSWRCFLAFSALPPVTAGDDDDADDSSLCLVVDSADNDVLAATN
jgi:hypothetical protein